jgi:hypothetical protein
MTRRGSLAYYLAAVAVGCFFASLFMFLSLGDFLISGPRRFAADFFAFYFISVPYGAFAAVLSAALLRRLMSALRWDGLWQWILSGAALTTVLVGLLYLIGWAASYSESGISMWEAFLLGGPFFLVEGGVWPATLAGALTAIVLRRIHLAFEPGGEETAHKSQ